MQNDIRGLVIFDLDGTLLRGPTICEVLAEPLGYLAEMRQLETVSSEEDITAARLKMAGWYKNHTITGLQNYLEHVCWAPGAMEGVAALRDRQIEVGLASITWSFAVEWCARRLGITHFLGTELLADGEIRHVWGRSKAAWMRELVKLLGVPAGRVAAVGDSSSDRDMLKVADLRFFVGPAVPAAVDRVVHIPNCDVRTVAERILGEWT